MVRKMGPIQQHPDEGSLTLKHVAEEKDEMEESLGVTLKLTK